MRRLGEDSCERVSGRFPIPASLLCGFALLVAAWAAAGDSSIPRFDDIAKEAGCSSSNGKGTGAWPPSWTKPGREFVSSISTETFGGTSISSERDLYGRGIRARNALYRNRDATFTDVTEKAGAPGNGYGPGLYGGRLR
jgi:hypothetical protein